MTRFRIFILVLGALLTLSPEVLFDSPYLRGFLHPSGSVLLLFLLSPYIVYFFLARMLPPVLSLLAGVTVVGCDLYIRTSFMMTDQVETGRLLFVPVPLLGIILFFALLGTVAYFFRRHSGNAKGSNTEF